MLTPERECCEWCGRDYAIWSAPSDIWNLAVRGGDRAAADEWGFLCPTCFMLIAEERALGQTLWSVHPEKETDYRYFLPSGRFTRSAPAEAEIDALRARVAALEEAGEELAAAVAGGVYSPNDSWGVLTSDPVLGEALARWREVVSSGAVRALAVESGQGSSDHAPDAPPTEAGA